jgi:hypothetical protein
MLMVCEIMNEFRIKLSVWCLIRNGGYMLILERPHMTYVYIYIYIYTYILMDSVSKSVLEKSIPLFYLK